LPKYFKCVPHVRLISDHRLCDRYTSRFDEAGKSFGLFQIRRMSCGPVMRVTQVWKCICITIRLYSIHIVDIREQS